MNSGNAQPPVLIADDDEISRLLLTETLQQAGFQTLAVADGAAALAAAIAQPFDLALLDVDMPRLDGYTLCRALRARDELKHLPVVMITGHNDAASITRAYEAGATDFIAKPVNWTLLPHRLRYILRNADADRQLRHLAYHDPLTDLPNAQALTELVTTALERAATASTAEGVALLQVNVSACTRIRAVFGSDQGDEALRSFARRLAQCVSAADTHGEYTALARADGDRFVVCIRASSIQARARTLAAAIMTSLDAPLTCGDHQFFLLPAIGIAFSPDHGVDAKSLITHAAAAKHHALSTDATGAIMYSTPLAIMRANAWRSRQLCAKRCAPSNRRCIFSPRSVSPMEHWWVSRHCCAGSIPIWARFSGSLHPAG